MLKYVRWRDDLGVLRLGIVLTDGKSNEFSMSCGRQTTKEVAASLRNDTIVYAIGVGVRENQDELLHIASKKEFTASLDSFNEAATMNDAVRYQLCSTSRLHSHTHIGMYVHVHKVLHEQTRYFTFPGLTIICFRKVMLRYHK